MEFTGRMTALPLQSQGELTAEQFEQRVQAAAAALAQFDLIEYVSDTDETIFRVEDGTENQVANALMAGGGFEYVEPDWRVYPIGCSNDPLLGNQWHHNANRMNSCAGWAIHTGNPSTVVAICDTGIRTSHVEFQLHRQEGFNAVNDLWESQGGQINDINGHGTATSGCAAANGNNGSGGSGVGWNLGHRMMRVSNSTGGGAQLSDLTQAARVASDQGDRAANVSYSGAGSSTINTAGAYVRSRGALLVWAAGNAGQTLNGNRDDNVIYVGATTSSDTIAGFSNRGSLVDLVAPGQSVFTTTRNSNTSHGSVSGTSFSAPLTAGLIGLIFSANPSLTPAECEQILRDGCDDLGSSGVDNIYGYGRIDVGNSLALVGGGCEANNYCTSNTNSSGNAATIGMSGSTSVAANDFGVFSSGCPSNQNGIFYMGLNQINSAFGNGRQCTSGSITRYRLASTDAFGIAIYAVDNTVPPALGRIVADSTWNWQYWFRDPMGGGSAFNTTDGLEVTYCP